MDLEVSLLLEELFTYGTRVLDLLATVVQSFFVSLQLFVVHPTQQTILALHATVLAQQVLVLL